MEEVINFAALQHHMFKDAIVPTCAITVRNAPCEGEPFWYSCPKPVHTQEDRYRIVIEPNDVHRIYPHEVDSAPWIWATLLWGSRRDLALINRLSEYPNLDSLEACGLVKSRDGIIRSKTKYIEYEQLIDRPLLNPCDFPADDSLFLDAARLGLNRDPNVYSKDSNDFQAFDLPQLVLKQSWMKSEQRFRAAIVRSREDLGGVVCTNTFATVHLNCEDSAALQTLCLVLNSVVAVYYLLLTSGRFAMDRNEPQLENFRCVPLPNLPQGSLEANDHVGSVDECVRNAFGFKEAEWILIDDLVQYTLPDYKEGVGSPGRHPTRRTTNIGKPVAEPELTAYCRTLQQVLHAGFGSDKQIGAVIFSEPTRQRLPVRMVSLYLNSPSVSSVQVEEMHGSGLQKRLTKLYLDLLDTQDRKSYYQRTVRTYDTISCEDNTGIIVNLVKPDQARYWTRSMAMRDADEIAADFLLWQGTREAQPLDQRVTHG